jgi:hypothetical protein
MIKSPYLVKRLITPNHVTLPGTRLYMFISVLPDATSQQSFATPDIALTIPNTTTTTTTTTTNNNNNNNNNKQ